MNINTNININMPTEKDKKRKTVLPMDLLITRGTQCLLGRRLATRDKRHGLLVFSWYSVPPAPLSTNVNYDEILMKLGLCLARPCTVI